MGESFIKDGQEYVIPVDCKLYDVNYSNLSPHDLEVMLKHGMIREVVKNYNVRVYKDMKLVSSTIYNELSNAQVNQLIKRIVNESIMQNAVNAGCYHNNPFIADYNVVAEEIHNN